MNELALYGCAESSLFACLRVHKGQVTSENLGAGRSGENVSFACEPKIHSQDVWKPGKFIESRGVQATNCFVL